MSIWIACPWNVLMWTRMQGSASGMRHASVLNREHCTDISNKFSESLWRTCLNIIHVTCNNRSFKMNPNPTTNQPKQTGQPGHAQPHTEDVHRQVKPPPIPLASTPAPKPVTAAGHETSVRPSSAAQGVATQATQSDAKAAHPPSKELHTGPPSTPTKAAAAAAAAGTSATLEPSARKPTPGPTQTTASIVRPVSSASTTAAATDGQQMKATADKVATGVPSNSNSGSAAAAAKAGLVDNSARSFLTDSEHLGVAYPRATTLSEAVTGQVRMSEAMLDAMQGGSVLDDTIPVEPFARARPSLQQVRFPTPYPPTPSDESQTTVNIKDVDGIEVFKRRRASVISDTESLSHMQHGADQHASKKSMKPKADSIDEEHLLSKGERPLKSSLRSDAGAKKKKGVKFCDVNGTELAAVRFYFDQDEAPEVPLYATAYLNLDEIYNPIPEETNDQKVLRPSFSQPGAAPDFIGRVHLNKVALEFCLVSDTEMNVTGTVRVANISFSKSVTIRYTTDQWKHTSEMKANYVYYAHDGATDRFSFIIQLPTTFGPGGQLQFAVKYEAGVEIFWDNNFGQNYKVECYTREMLQMATNSSYLSSMQPTFTWLQYL